MVRTIGNSSIYPRRFGSYYLLAALNVPFVGSLHLAVARDRGVPRLLALKILGPRLTDAEDIARFRDEANAVGRLSHRNLVRVLDSGLFGDEAFLVMDLVEGKSLRAIWNRCAREQIAFPINICVYLVKELCHGLAHVHACPGLGLVHRNVTPSKILVSYTGEIQLGDFSLAVSAPVLERTEPEFVYGSIAYLSPEQARAETLDGRSDLYSAGIVLWELLTGRQLFPPRKLTGELTARTQGPAVAPPSLRAPRVPAELDEICRSALAGRKLDRYADCNEMAMALQTWLAHNAPAIGDTQMASFVQQLFAEDLERERFERDELNATVEILLGKR